MQFEYSLSGKWLELLKQMAPNVTRAAILWDPTIPAGIGQFAVIQSVVTRGRRETNKYEQHVRDRTRHRYVRGPTKWRSDRDGKRIGSYSS